MRKSLFAASAAILVMGAAPAAGPLASYSMDVATASGFGAGMTGSDPASVMRMMNNGMAGSSKTLALRLHARGAPVAASADHWIPASLGMGAKLPLLAPEPTAYQKAERYKPNDLPRPKGRILSFWGCGEHVGAGQPKIIDLAAIKPGQMPAGMASMAMAYGAATATSPRDAEWPNRRDQKPVPANGSILGAHKVESGYAPAIGYSLAAGQDFMPALGLRETGGMPSGAVRLQWNPTVQATGYALHMAGASENGDVVIWSSSASGAVSPTLDYLAPAEVRRQVAAGTVLSPATSQCMLPAEVAKASPAGAVNMIGYGPYVDFAEQPKAPKWVARLRYKTTAMMMLGMGDMGAGDAPMGPAPGQPAKKKKRFGLGDALRRVAPVPIP